MRWLLICLLLTFNAHAKSVEGVEFPDELTVGTTKLILNGAGLRTKRKFAMNFRVYVAGLYVTEKSKDAAAILKNPSVKVIELSFLRTLDADTLREAWTEGLDKNCATDCDKAKASLKEFNALMVDVKEKSRLKVTFEKDSVAVEADGKTKSSGKVAGEAFRNAMLAVFIGDHPPTEDLKKALLGN